MKAAKNIDTQVNMPKYRLLALKFMELQKNIVWMNVNKVLYVPLRCDGELLFLFSRKLITMLFSVLFLSGLLINDLVTKQT